VQPTGPPTPVSIQEGASDAQVNGGEISQQTAGHGSFDFGMIPSPQIEQRQDQGQDQRNQRGRKRKFFDDPIVLTNEFMRKNLNDTRKIRRKRKDVTTSTFGNWELKSKRLKEDVFDQPLFTGLCKELINIHKREYILSKPHLVISEEDHPDNTTRTSPIIEVADEPIPDAPEIIGNGNASGVEDIERMRSDANASPPIIPT
ncbi:sister chromatid cohesion 1 protein 3-like, partial [Trifolium medium]|nr:sister chromatid cohesion 1 protein 3-like [Trifolium medium]